ncbi:hypothetical protein [Hymenobacter sp. DG25A]|uniref:hypothetical protein n=1 Tax=Hymenobacter sp. DG25A TaxID=1385663 RepID=UPI0006BC4355|nr:hypothetical protein [Hymenobacter sp. DG25A]ALD21729.1 hypothetical protein AM218_11560 [Hymenobacter sp. DG25A]
MHKIFLATVAGLLALALISSCKEENVNLQLNCARGRVIGPSCNGLLIQLLEETSVGQNITYQDTVYTNVFGTYSPLPDTLKAGDTFVFSLQPATDADATAQPCLAIYQSYDVPQLTVGPPKCLK